MTILPIINAPNPILKKVSSAVNSQEINDDLKSFMNNMLETMYKDSGVGLAAVQVGVLKRLVVMDINYQIEECNSENHHHHDHIINKKPIFLINPEIIFRSKESTIYYEGCLSFPEIRADISRASEVVVKYLDLTGKEQKLEASGLAATCIQHEIDHLNGITFIEYLSKLKQEIILKKLKKFKK